MMRPKFRCDGSIAGRAGEDSVNVTMDVDNEESRVCTEPKKAGTGSGGGGTYARVWPSSIRDREVPPVMI